MKNKYSIKQQGESMHREEIRTDIPGFVLRFAQEEDVGTILFFIQELAKYEKMENEVFATEQLLHTSLFLEHAAEVLLAEFEGKTVGYALFLKNYSAFLGRTGIYLEDLYLVPEARNKGLGKKILAFLAHMAVERNYGRVEWLCLDWNEPSRKFYDKLGAKTNDEFIGYRLSGQAMADLADTF
jgi:GNAT superfamily N-acetyltransferase